MRSSIYWVETGVAGRLGIMARPRGHDWLDVEVQGFREAGVQTVVSLLEPEEASSLGLDGERQACESGGLGFLSFPIQDRSVPPRDGALRDVLHALREEVQAGRSVVIHCRAGIGRSSLMAAGVLTLLGISPDEALQRLTVARGGPIPDTPEQRQWVLDFPGSYRQ